MKAIILASLALLGCSSGLQSMAWKVDCATTTPETLAERYEYENPYYVCSEYMDLDACPAIWVHRYRYEWAKKEWLKRCGSAHSKVDNDRSVRVNGPEPVVHALFKPRRVLVALDVSRPLFEHVAVLVGRDRYPLVRAEHGSLGHDNTEPQARQ